jgi:hypothetical protein
MWAWDGRQLHNSFVPKMETVSFSEKSKHITTTRCEKQTKPSYV